MVRRKGGKLTGNGTNEVEWVTETAFDLADTIDGVSLDSHGHPYC